MTNPGKTKRQSVQEPESLCKKRATIRRIAEKQGSVEKTLRVERKQASQQLESNYALLTALINSPRDIIIFSLDKNYQYTAFNRKHCEEMKKVWAADINIGDNMLDFIRIPELRAKAKASMDRALSGEIITEIQHQFNLDIYYEFNWNPVYFNKEVIGVTSFICDITERKQAEEEIRTLSLTDDLTGLYNRRAFFVLAKQQLRIAKRTKREMFLFYADIDGLKHINDMFGHQVGDTALIDAAVVLKKTFRESDIIARIGGDEFVVLTIETTIESKEVLMKRLQENLEVHNLQENRKYRLDVSIGGAFCDSQHPCSLDDLIAQADKLMYDQKGEKKKKWSPETHLPNGRDR